MKTRMIRLLCAAALILCCLTAGTAGAEEDTLLRLTFDEGSGTVVSDVSGHLPDAEVQYQYLHAAYTESMEPEWRQAGVDGGSLLFDGCSTCIRYPKDAVQLQGDALVSYSLVNMADDHRQGVWLVYGNGQIQHLDCTTLTTRSLTTEATRRITNLAKQEIIKIKN